MKLHLPLLVFAIATAAGAPCLADEPSRDATAVALDNPFVAHSLDEFAVTRDRPLFSPGRRPPPPPAAPRVAAPAPPPPPPAPPDLALFGTLVDAAGGSAIVRPGPSEKPVRVRIGDDVKGWTVAAIDARKIVLALDDQTVTFAMFNGGRVTAHAVVGHHPPPVLEVNSRGVLTAHRVTKPAPP
jgi:hypothetical protein